MSENIFYILAHPINALRAKARQIDVAIEHATPPAGTSIEEFPDLSVEKAANLMGLNAGGVPLGKWPKTARDQMIAGEIIHPDGRHPEHPNI